MKVLLVQPPIEDFYDTSVRTYPLGLMSIGTAIRDIADVTLYDARTGKGRGRPVGEPPGGLEEYYRPGRQGPFSLFQRFRRYGDDEAAIARTIREQGPDIVGISCLCTTYAREALAVARITKAVDRRIVTVVGGLHPTLFPEHVLEGGHVDFCIRGEGETPFRRLVSALCDSRGYRTAVVPGVCFRDGGRPVIAPPHIEEDIDIVPDRSLVDPEHYKIGRKRLAFFLSSRGCPLSCTFCGKPAVPYRRRSLSAIERDIDTCLALGIEAVDFEDDMLTLDKRFFREVLDRFRGRGLTLSAMNGIDVDTLEEDLLDEMREAGFRRLSFSLVDASACVREGQGRRSGANLHRLLDYLEGSDTPAEVHFIIGLPNQTPRDVITTVVSLMGLRVLLGPSIYYVAPNTPAFGQAFGDRWEDSLPLMRSSAMFPANPLFPRGKTYTLMKLVRFINYVKAAVDANAGLDRLSDLPLVGRDEKERRILSALVGEKAFVCYDRQAKAFVPEPCDEGLVRSFFEEASGLVIKGYKTSRVVTVDG